MSQTCSQNGELGEGRTQAESHVELEVRQFLEDFGTHYPMGPVTFGVLAYYTGKAKSEESNHAKDLRAEASRAALTKRGKGLSIDFTKCFQKLGEAAHGAGSIPEPTAEAARQSVQVICAGGQVVAPSGGYSQASEAEEHVANHKGMATQSHERKLETQAEKRTKGDADDPRSIDRGYRLKPIFEIIAEDKRLQDKLGDDRVKQLAEIVRKNMKMHTLCEVCQRHFFPSRLVEHRAACLREQQELSPNGQSMLGDMLRDGYHLFQRDLSDENTLGYHFMKPILCKFCNEYWPAWFLNDHWRAHFGKDRAPTGSVKDQDKNMKLFYRCHAELDDEQLMAIQEGYSLCYLEWVGWNQWPDKNPSGWGQETFFFDVGSQLLRAIDYCASQPPGFNEDAAQKRFENVARETMRLQKEESKLRRADAVKVAELMKSHAENVASFLWKQYQRENRKDSLLEAMRLLYQQPEWKEAFSSLGSNCTSVLKWDKALRFLAVGAPGVGKSTIGNIVLRGKFNAPFKTSKGCDACTLEPQSLSENGVTFTDVPGFPAVDPSLEGTIYSMVTNEAEGPVDAILFIFKNDPHDLPSLRRAAPLMKELQKARGKKILVINEHTNYGEDFEEDSVRNELQGKSAEIKNVMGLTFDLEIFIPRKAMMHREMESLSSL